MSPCFCFIFLSKLQWAWLFLRKLYVINLLISVFIHCILHSCHLDRLAHKGTEWKTLHNSSSHLNGTPPCEYTVARLCAATIKIQAEAEQRVNKCFPISKYLPVKKQEFFSQRRKDHCRPVNSHLLSSGIYFLFHTAN